MHCSLEHFLSVILLVEDLCFLKELLKGFLSNVSICYRPGFGTFIFISIYMYIYYFILRNIL